MRLWQVGNDPAIRNDVSRMRDSDTPGRTWEPCAGPNVPHPDL